MGNIWSSILALLCRNAEICLSTYIYFIANRYVQACHKVLQTDSLKLDQFSKELLPSLLTLSMDKIPNVRISVAQLISQCLLPLGNVDYQGSLSKLIYYYGSGIVLMNISMFLAFK